MIQRLLSSSMNKKAEKASTTASSSSGTFEGKELQVRIECQTTLNQFRKELQQGAHRQTKRIQMTLYQVNPYTKISSLRNLEDVFVTIGSLPQLEEIVFTNSNILVSTLSKLLKKSSLESLKFHSCTFIAKKMEQVQDKLWKGIQLQKDLAILEILNCSYSASENLCRDRLPFVYSLPPFLQEQQNLKRLVLDECILDNDEQETFKMLLSNSTSLEELEIRPVFEASKAECSSPYQVKKQAIRTFLTKTIPSSLSNKVNTTLTKLVVSLEDYHLEKVYDDAMMFWIDLVQHNNFTLTDLRLTHLPLMEVPATDDNLNNLHECDLRSYLQRNKAAAAQQQKARQSLPLKEETERRQESESSETEDAEAADPPAKEESVSTESSTFSSVSSEGERGGRKPVAKPLPRTNSLSPSQELVTEVWV